MALPRDLTLARIYRGAERLEGADDGVALEAALRHLFDEGARAWPGVGLAVEAFVSYLARLAQRNAGSLPAPERGPDLYLACACTVRVPGALEAFDRAHLARIDAYLARLGPSPAFVDEVRQEVRGKLYVGRDGAPWIAEYDGRGALASWVRVVSIRTAIDLRRQEGPAPASDRRAEHAPSPGDPERDLQRERYQKAFGEALRGAVLALGPDHRRILRRHFAEGATLEALAEELGVHRATVARHVAAARLALKRDARRRLRMALGCPESEMESLAAVMRSQLDLSLPTLLRTA
jgi:RNA polymerase sigma-70 factor (ECF subfamily)